MNKPSNPADERPLENPQSEREWQAQECALQAERAGRPARDGDARTRQYRLIARALGETPAAGLPPDFAATVVRRVQAQRRYRGSLDPEPFAAPFERRLLQALIALFGVAIGICAAVYGGADVLRALGDGAAQLRAYARNSWLLAFAACLALPAAMQLWQPRRR